MQFLLKSHLTVTPHFAQTFENAETAPPSEKFNATLPLCKTRAALPVTVISEPHAFNIEGK